LALEHLRKLPGAVEAVRRLAAAAPRARSRRAHGDGDGGGGDDDGRDGCSGGGDNADEGGRQPLQMPEELSLVRA
jgi:hypothetical protein